MDKGMGRATAKPSPAITSPTATSVPQELEGVVRNGLVELTNGKLPEGTRVQIRVKK
jgi:hypothetical protein